MVEECQGGEDGSSQGLILSTVKSLGSLEVKLRHFVSIELHNLEEGKT